MHFFDYLAEEIGFEPMEVHFNVLLLLSKQVP